MRPASDDDEDAPQKDDMAVVHGEASGEGAPPGDRRPEPRVDADDRMPEEAGYGYGV